MNESTTARKVLVVDDDPIIGKSVGRVLGEGGYVVTTAYSGAEALALLETNKFDMVFTDIRMPGMDGIELAERIGAKWPDLPVAVITAFGAGEVEARAKELGVFAFLRKPLTPEMMLGAAQLALIRLTKGAVERVLFPPENRTWLETLRDISLFVLSPLIALVYIVGVLTLGPVLLVWIAVRALRKQLGWG